MDSPVLAEVVNDNGVPYINLTIRDRNMIASYKFLGLGDIDLLKRGIGVKRVEDGVQYSLNIVEDKLIYDIHTEAGHIVNMKFPPQIKNIVMASLEKL